jgi:pyruvate formate lyase activating enzyme
MLAAVVFCQGCAWACPYCQNPSLRPFGPGERPWADVLDWLAGRAGLLDAVVFSGGEPLLQPGLAAAMDQARELGFAVGLHTNGQDPAALARVLPRCDWVGLDVKAPRAGYGRISGVEAGSGGAEAAWRSLALLAENGIPFEVRTTWHPALLSAADLTALARELSPAGPLTWAVQAFQPGGCADAALAGTGRTAIPAALAQDLGATLGPGSRFTVRD